MDTEQHDIDTRFTQIDGWLELTRMRLFKRWYTTTGHRDGASNRTWACEIARQCRTCNEHLSVPCSLLQEANEIGQFLNTQCYSETPTIFLRLYLIILSEFVRQLRDVATLIGVSVKKPPTEICIWSNRWAKHRLHLLVQHHPEFLFADSFGEDWDEIVAKLPACTALDRCNNSHPILIIDYQWLCQAEGKSPDLSDANDERQAVVAVPPLITFLDQTISYFREFIDACLEKPELVRKFESEHFTLRC